MSLEGVVGATIGFFATGGSIQGALYGYGIGSSVGAYLEGGPDVQGPRLSDLKVQSSAYGAPIPIIYGKARVSGNVIWATPIRERKIKEDAGGKGGGGSTVTTYEYYGSFAVGLCDNEIAGVRKIWADSVLIYDLGDTASLETIQASNRNADKITIYYGTETQEADSLIQADQGVDNTQAYRGTAYIVFDDLLLEKYGNRIPSITCEVISAGAVADREVSRIEFEDKISSPVDNTAVRPMVNGSTLVSHLTSDRSVTTIYQVRANDSREALFDITTGSSYQGIFNHALPSDDFNYIARGRSVVFDSHKFRLYLFDENGLIDKGGSGFICSYAFDNTSTDVSGCSSSILDGNVYIYSDGASGSSERAVYSAPLDDGFSATQLSSFFTLQTIVPESDIASTAVGAFVYPSGIYILHDDDTIDVFSLLGVFQNTITVTGLPTLSYSAGEIQLAWDDVTGEMYLYTGSIRDEVYAINDSGQATLIAELRDTDGLAQITVSNKVIYGVVNSFTSHYYAHALESLTDASVTLSSVVSDLNDRTGLAGADCDTTALTDTVEGYVVTRPMSARKAIEPLQQAFFFDACEKDNVLTYVKRGGSSVASIPEEDLGAGETDLYILTRQQDSELPAQVVVDYIDLNRSYQEGAQRAQRINSPQENVVKVSLPIVGTADYFKEIAHVLLYNAHTERETFKLSLTGEYIDLNPTDVITFTADSDTRKVRITKINYGDVITIDAVAEDSTVYSVDATAGTGEATEQTVGLEGPTKLYLMDIPLLRNQDDDAGLYIAGSGYFSAWTGASVFKSLDGGTSYSQVEDILTSSVMGKATTVLADASHTTFDRASTVTVSLTSGTLSSSTESAVIQGANFALLGTEIIQFVNVTDNGDDTYTLDTLLRGRRGTDWATDTHAVGDQFCLLRENVIERIGAVVNTERYYKAVSFGTYLDEATAQVKTNTGVSQKPFSVKNISHTRNGSDDIALSWTRRSRYIGTPLWDLPVFEDSESYKIEVLSGGSVVNTYTSSSESYTYTATQQTNDGFTPGDPIDFNIYQVGAVDGYGTEYEAA